MDPLRRIARTASHTGALLRRAFSRSTPHREGHGTRPDLRFLFESGVNDSETACGEEDTLSQVAPGGMQARAESNKGCLEEVKEESDYIQHIVEKRMPGLEIHLTLLGLESSIDAMYNSLEFSAFDVKQWEVEKVQSYFMYLDLLEPESLRCADELLKADVSGYTLLGMNEESLRQINIPERQAVLLGVLIQAWKGQLGPMVEYVDGVPSEPHPWATEELYSACMLADHIAKTTGEGAVYGQLMVLGYKEYRVHGSTWHPVGRRNERFVMKRALVPTGIQRHRVVCETEGERPEKPRKHQRKSSSRDGSDGGLQTVGGVPSHVISMTIGPSLTNNPNADPSQLQSTQTQKVSFQFTSDRSKDMFQLGRMLVSQNDFVVRGPLHMDSFGALCGPVSRYACRIECDRLPPFKTRIYAAGFNDKQQIFLSENAPKWQHGHTLEGWDALTTFGVRIWRPDTREWREISVNGNVYLPRENMSVAGTRMPLETNELVDGCIIDLAGIQLLYQSPSTLASQSVCISEREVVKMLNAKRPQCPVMMHTIAFSSEENTRIPQERKPYVFPACGHVHGYAPELNGKPCPLCRCVGPFVPLNVQWEPGLCADAPTVVFNPCGHMVTEQVAEYWASISLPDNAPPNARYRPICPFCARPLRNTDTERPYNKLIVQERGIPRSNSSSSVSSLISWEDKSSVQTPTANPKGEDSPSASPVLPIPSISPVANPVPLPESPPRHSQTHTQIHSHTLMMRNLFSRNVPLPQGPVFVPVSAPQQVFEDLGPPPNPHRNPRPTRNFRHRSMPTLDLPQLMQLTLGVHLDTNAFMSQAGPPMPLNPNLNPIVEDEDQSHNSENTQSLNQR